MIIDSLENRCDPDCLLSAPTQDQTSQVNRDESSYKNLSEKYLLWQRKDVTRQYFNLYAARLAKMRPLVEAVAAKKWENVPLKYLHELKEETGHCFIVGTIYKKQDLKPSILKEISDENSLVPQPIAEKFVGEDDQLILEDELQRIHLVGNIETEKLVTGVICAVKGSEEEGSTGKFKVEEICFAGLPEPQPRILPNEERFLLLVSGLGMSDNVDNLLPLELLVDYVTGQLGHTGEQGSIAKIARVIIAGNSIGSKVSEKPNKVRQIQELDDIFTQLSSVCPVDVMPGEYDPANQLMPQQPLHRCMFPKSSVYSTMQNVTNPYECEVMERTIIGTSGQNVQNIVACSTIEDPLDILESFCDWGHLAPTAPDTLKSYPFYEYDPFSIDVCPDIVFAGNQKEFNFKKVSDKTDRDILFITVPTFNETGTCVLVNLKNLTCQPLVFGFDQDIDADVSSPAAEK